MAFYEQALALAPELDVQLANTSNTDVQILTRKIDALPDNDPKIPSMIRRIATLGRRDVARLASRGNRSIATPNAFIEISNLVNGLMPELESQAYNAWRFQWASRADESSESSSPEQPNLRIIEEFKVANPFSALLDAWDAYFQAIERGSK